MRPAHVACLALALGTATLPAHAKPKDVKVVNDLGTPVPVEDAFVREPFAFSDSDRRTSTFVAFRFDVPEDRRLFVESIGALIEACSGSITQAEVTYVLDGVLHQYPLPTIEGFEGSFSVHENLRLYADPGSSIRLQVDQGFLEPIFARVAISGYLIDPLSPSLAP